MNENKCGICGVKFDSKEKLMAHNQEAHSMSEGHAGHQHYTCKACGVSFHSERELIEHNKKAHKM